MMTSSRALRCGLATSVSLVLAGAVTASDATPHTTPLSAVARIGRQMFSDTSLSGNGQMSCASCHSPSNHYAPDFKTPVALGGPDLDQPGYRAVPTLTYKDRTPGFSVGPVLGENEAAEASPMSVSAGRDQARGVIKTAAQAPQQAKNAATSAANMVPRGGMFWDGRAATLQDQTAGPLMSRFEMANTGIAGLAGHIRATYGRKLAQLFGDAVLQDDQMLVSEAEFAIGRYESEDPDFHPYSSKYDAWLAGRATLTPAEERGRKLFDDPKKGNCADCHVDTVSADGQPPVFTDYEYEALGAPRNPAIPANADPAFFDLGICGPMRDDSFAKEAANCGMFKTPTLRNVATRHVFFHNGVYDNLRDVVRFYVQRSTSPEMIYHGAKTPDDLPAKYAANLDVIDPPFDRRYGAKPALDAQEIDDIVAFLDTLTDGWTPKDADR